MTKVIWKYDVPSSPSKAEGGGGKFDRNMPVGAEIICLDKQYGVPRLWVLLDPDTDESEQRHFLIVGTGGRIPDGTKYIGTWQVPKGDVVDMVRLVWHLFEYV